MMKRSYLKRSTKPLKRVALSPLSKKQSKRLREYSKLRKAYLEKHPVCEGCGEMEATDIHHKNHRGENTNNVDDWMATCRRCHDSIHKHPEFAREKGWLV